MGQAEDRRAFAVEVVEALVAAGYAADGVWVPLERITGPWGAPEADPLELTLTRARAGDVETVLVGGEVVFDRGEPTRFDEQEAARAFADALEETAFPADAAEMVDVLKPKLKDWDEGWDVPELRPWTAHNSR